MSDRYALIGNPVKHSLSPRIHALFAEQTRQDLSYELLLAPSDGFTAALTEFRQKGGKGVNVTLPFKAEACRYADAHSVRATQAGVANTLLFRNDGEVYADNTDGVGLCADLRRLDCPVRGRSLLVVGAGGACRGIVPALLEMCPWSLVIANRTAARAQELAACFGSLGTVAACSLEDLAGRSFDGVINATSASLDNTLPDLPDSLAGSLSWGYDLAYYASEPTVFVRWLTSRGIARAYDGIGMLVAQAAASFYLWRGVKPEIAPVRVSLQNQIR